MKEYREKELKNYVIGNIIIIVFISLQMNPVDFLSSDYYKLTVTVLSTALVSAALYSFVFVFDSIIPAEWKPKVASFTRHMPGETIWTDIKEKSNDKRFSSDEVKAKYKEIYARMPTDKNEQYEYQNNQWYHIYSEVQKQPKVEQAQKDFLLCRDLNCATVLIFVFYIAFSGILHVVEFSPNVCGYIVALYVLLAWATRAKGERFVKTAIAVDLNTKQSPK